MTEKGSVDIYTDGACSGNPGPGGWGAVLRYGDTERELSGGEADTTNNRMELMAAIVALETLTRPCNVQLTTDSNYVLKGITEWIEGWTRKGWKKVKNRDLWERLDRAVGPHEIDWVWVRGHSGDPMNERGDQLAAAAAVGRGQHGENAQP